MLDTEIPSGFDSRSIADLLADGLFVDGDWIESKDQDANGEVRLIQLADIGDGTFRNRSSRHLTMAKARELGCTFLEPGDILIARMPEPLGRACVFPGVGCPAVTAVDICIARPNPSRVNPSWLVTSINAPGVRASMQEFVRGTTRQRISRKNLGIIRLFVPTLEQQSAIARGVEAFEKKRMAASGHLSRARTAAQLFRRSVLTAACTGRLTADWRLHHAQGEDAAPDDIPGGTDPDVLPPTWSVHTVGEIGAVMLGGTPSRKEASYWRGAIPWVSSGEVDNCRIAATRETISDEGIAASSAKIYPVGTVLIAMIGEGKTRGQAAILDIEAATNQNVAGVLADRQRLNPEYLWRWALAQYDVTRAVGRGGNQPALNGQKVRDLVIAVPPLAEQDEIVMRVDRLLASVDVVDRRLGSVAIAIERSSRAVLSQASRGELTSDDHLESANGSNT